MSVIVLLINRVFHVNPRRGGGGGIALMRYIFSISRQLTGVQGRGLDVPCFIPGKRAFISTLWFTCFLHLVYRVEQVLRSQPGTQLTWGSKATVTLACHIYTVVIETASSPTVLGKKSTARRFSFIFLSPHIARHLTINSFPVTGVPGSPFCNLIQQDVLCGNMGRYAHYTIKHLFFFYPLNPAML